MKQLWIVNKCCGDLHVHLFSKKSTGGLWLDAMVEQVHTHPEDRIAIVNFEAKPKIQSFRSENVTYYTFAGAPNARFNWKDRKIAARWRCVLEEEEPDIIVLWGTEFPFYFSVPDDCRVPAVIYVQGILDSIGKYYTAGLSNKELATAFTFRNIVERNTVKSTQKAFSGFRSAYEKEIVRRVGRVIIEHQWAASYCRKMYTGVQCYRLPIGISGAFSGVTWTADGMQPHTVMCPAADYPIKGLHMLLKALAIVKESYPDVRLYVPGPKLRRASSLRGWLYRSGYEKLIAKMIDTLGLSENVIYTGRLTGEEMAGHMASVNAFVMCSAIENHSSTLKEAMTVCAPCVASYVGGVPEYAVHRQNALLYRFEDYEMLAQEIMELFADRELCEELSAGCKAQRDARKQDTGDYTAFRNILTHILQQNGEN